MVTQSFKCFFEGKTISNGSLITESNDGIIKHLTHLEELILTKQKDGLNTAVSFLDELLKSFTGHNTDKVFTTVKYDGAPAIIAGYNPENNKFFVSTKGLANVNPKINYTEEDIVRNHGNAPGLVEKLKLGLRYLPSVIKQGIYQGDFMYDKRDLNIADINGEKNIIFKPNTITYAVPMESELGKKILTSKVGVIFHTKYTGPTLSQLSKSSDVNIGEFTQTPDVWVDDAKFKDVSGTVTFTEQETNEVKSLISKIQSLGETIPWEKLPPSFFTLANTYINVLIRQGKFITDPENEFNGFIQWYSDRMQTDINKLKTARGREQKEQALASALDTLNINKNNIVNVFELSKELELAKRYFINKYNTAVKTKQFITQPDGTLKVTAPEGYVAIDHFGNMVKLVDRLEFSKANFAVTKQDKFQNK